ncbi:MAG: cyclic nucleotide-binding domain-containing protein [Betaproteobacteria bacterium]|nr:cyclic nucleotide-binding domain-containing protein [Betaproteobacteria bacterium]
MAIKALVLFDHEPFTELLLGLLPELDDDVDVRLMTHSSPGALGSRDLEGVRLLLCDLRTSASDAFVPLVEITRRHPDLAVVVFGSEDDLVSAQRFQQHQRITCIPKSYGRETLVPALRLVLSSDSGDAELGTEFSLAREGGESGAVPSLRDLGLTDAESDVLRLAAQGKTNHEIALALGKSEGTVRIQMSAILRKLKVRNRSEAIIVAMRVIKVVRSQIEHAQRDELDIGFLLPHMEYRRYPAGHAVFHKGDIADELYLIQRGRVSLPEIGKELKEHDLFGEIGIFAPDHKRTCSAVCATDVDLFALSEDKVKQAYYLNPGFAMFVLNVITTRLLGRNEGLLQAGHSLPSA